MGSKFSFLERHHENSVGAESSAVAHSIEATETEGTQTPSGLDDNTYAPPPSEIGPPGYEPLTYGTPGLTNTATAQTAFGMMPRYDFGGAPYGMDFMNNAYISHYDLPGASAHDPYDEDEVFMRQPPTLYPNNFNPYVGNIGYPNNVGYLGNAAYPGMYGYGGYPGSAALYAYPAAESACVEQGDTMRYVQCLENGVLAVWGDERNEYFPQQFSKEASIYCFTDVNDRSLVLANKMIANVLIQTSKADQKALEQEQLSEETHSYKPLNKIIQKLKRSKSSAKESAIEASPSVKQLEENENIEAKMDENDKPSTSAENSLEQRQLEENGHNEKNNRNKDMEQSASSETKPTDSESETNQQHQDEAVDGEKKE